MALEDEAKFMDDSFTVCGRMTGPFGDEIVRITLEWEKDPRNAVTCLTRVAENSQILAALFSESTELAKEYEAGQEERE
ncbi:hypothetical protein [Mycobacterium phage Azrael100]|uniref:Uncharacterized protein n=1 Tax=Mycobacterium phage Cosmo TaxID=1567467 RepID=A0A0B4ZZW4_9CAUD|nr:hypothetical protein COSMO_76 [Mycobacterium phage Cosmo]WKR36086.1 hypothetical protein [Mycobacterium phage Azrael100]